MTLTDIQLDYFKGLDKQRKVEWLKANPESIGDVQESIGPDELIAILGLTIKRDEANKLLTFIGQLSAYTEDSQLNISFNAPSSSGKSFIPTEICRLFPKEDVIEVGYCSPTAFFHDVGEFDKEKGGYYVDLSRKIMIFLDQPHQLLLQHLRPMLSHDSKEIRIKVTDKAEKHGMKTKNIFLIGFPAVVFCTAGMKIDEQEATRFLLLSPEINQEKIREAIHAKILREADVMGSRMALEDNYDRFMLMRRIEGIKQAHITDIRISETSADEIERYFLEKMTMVKPRHQRDIGKIIGLVKVFALLNLWFRDRDGQTITANAEDVGNAFLLWDKISESQDLNLPPYVYNVYKDVFLPTFEKKNSESYGGVTTGLQQKDVIKGYFSVYGRFLPDWQLRQEIIPMLEASGLISLERDTNDKRKVLMYPTTSLTISEGEK